MKVTKTHIRAAQYLIASAAAYAITMMGLTYIFGVKNYAAHIDQRIAPQFRSQLATHIQTLPGGLRVSPGTVAQAVQDQFSWVKGLSLHRIPTNSMHVKVSIEEPRVKINNSIITERLRVLPASTYIEKSLEQLPAVTVSFLGNAQDDIPEQFVKHAHIFTEKRFSPYTITWMDEYHARLVDREEPHFIILFNAFSIPDASIFAHCASIKKQLEERGSFKGRNKETRWIADVRFDRQVIVFSEKGG